MKQILDLVPTQNYSFCSLILSFFCPVFGKKSKFYVRLCAAQIEGIHTIQWILSMSPDVLVCFILSVAVVLFLVSKDDSGVGHLSLVRCQEGAVWTRLRPCP